MIDDIFGENKGKILSTPSPYEIFLTVKLSFMPFPPRAIQTPSKAWILSLVPSTTLTSTFIVSPGLKSGICLPELNFSNGKTFV